LLTATCIWPLMRHRLSVEFVWPLTAGRRG